MESSVFLSDLLTAHEPTRIPSPVLQTTLSPIGGEGVRGRGSWEASTTFWSRIGAMKLRIAR